MINYLIFRILEFLLMVLIVVVPNAAFVYILLRFRKFYSKLYILGLLVIAVVYFNKLFLGYTLAQPDFNRFLVPFFDFFGESIRSVAAPLWNPHFGYGFDNWRIFTAPFFGPFTFLSAFFEVYTFLNIYLIIQHMVLLVGGFVFGRTLKMKNYEALAFAIFWTFNGWVCMRLNQGVGYEYMISYKWIPWALASATFLVQKKSFRNVLLLGFCMGFLFEGTPNIGIFGSVLVSCYFLLLALRKDFSKDLCNLILSGFCAVIFFLPKILPPLLAQNDVSFSTRLIWDATGWRAGLLAVKDFYKYFLPFNGNGVAERGFFTPGMIGFALLIVYFGCLICRLVRGRKLEKYDGAFVCLFFVGFVLSTENMVSSVFWNLPVFRKVTRIPTSLILLTVTVPYFVTRAVGILGESYKMWKIRDLSSAFFVIVAIAVFFEVLIGPRYFGVDSYTFDFLKFKPKEELNNFVYLKNLSNQTVYGTRFPDMVTPFYATSINEIMNVNTTHYFMGNDLIEKKYSTPKDIPAVIERYSPHYLISPNEVKLNNLKLADIYSTNKESEVHNERSYQMEAAKAMGKWDGNLYVYENEEFDPSWANSSSSLNEFSVDSDSVIKRGGLLPLSYNSDWIPLNGGILSLDKESGLTRVRDVRSETLHLIYFPWKTYLAFCPSFLLIIIFLRTSIRVIRRRNLNI